MADLKPARITCLSNTTIDGSFHAGLGSNFLVKAAGAEDDAMNWNFYHALEISIYPVNGLVFQPEDYFDYGMFLTNHSSSAIQVNAAVYASNQSNWRWNLFGPLYFTIPGDTTFGPIIRSDQIPWGAPPISAYICAEANTVHDCYQVTIE